MLWWTHIDIILRFQLRNQVIFKTHNPSEDFCHKKFIEGYETFGTIVLVREYWMIYRRPGFLAVAGFSSTPTPSHPLSRQQAVSLSRSSYVSSVPLIDGEAREWARSKIIRSRESLALYESFNALCILVVLQCCNLLRYHLNFVNIPFRESKWIFLPVSLQRMIAAI